MKKILLFIGVLLLANTTFSQMFTFGVKGGLNATSLKFDEFSAKVDVDPSNPAGSTIQDVKIKPYESEYGYHFGIFGRIKILAIFVQPEILFSSVGSTIKIDDYPNLDDAKSIVTVNYNRMDIPILVGIKFGPVRVGLGPVATFNLSSTVDAADEIKGVVEDYTSVSNSATFGGQVGVGLDILKKLTFDLRYEFGLSTVADGVTIGGTEYKTDQRLNQVVASIGFMF
jgi:hypothetical protein